MRKNNWKSITSGIMAIVAGVFGFIRIIRIAIDSRGIDIIVHGTSVSIPVVASSLPIKVVLAILVVVAIVGGIFSLRGKIWGLAFAGSIAAVFLAWPLGVAALVMIALNRQEFNKPS
jgi:hypothetical protein